MHLTGFQCKVFKTATNDFHNFALLEAVEFVDYNGDVYILPKGATSDLCSIPELLTSVLPANTAAWEGYLHDCAYRDTLQRADGTYWSLTEEQSNNLFERALKLSPNSGLVDWDLFHAVEWFGKSSFDEDRAKGRAAFLVSF